MGLIPTIIAEVANIVPGTHQLEFKRELGLEDSMATAASKVLAISSSGVVDAHIAPFWYNFVYLIDIEVGNPPQQVTVQVDTGSTDLWILAKDSVIGGEYNRSFGYFDKSLSTTYKHISNQFRSSFEDNSGSTGEWFKDDVSIAGRTVKDFSLGLATNSSRVGGMLGLGPDGIFAGKGSNEYFCYRNYPHALVDSGITKSGAYSLFLNSSDSSSGSLIFGGVDSNLYTGDLYTLPSQVCPPLGTQLDSISFDGKTVPVKSYVAFDSGASFSYLPAAVLTPLLESIETQTYKGFTLLNCSWASDQRIIEFKLGCATIKTKLSDFVIPIPSIYVPSIYESLNNTICLFGIQSAESSSGNPAILGDTFLRSAYVVYDMDSQEISIAQSNTSAVAKDSNIQVIPSGRSVVPGAKKCPSLI